MPAVVLSIVLVVALGGSARSAPAWAPAASAAIHPGVQTVTEGAQCTANFVFYDSVDVYIGQAAHCSSTGASTDVNGCEAGVLPLGTKVEVDGASRLGTLVYNSWNAMQMAGESNEDVCFGNDFALIRLDPADHGKVNPSVPFWGGPNGLDGSTPAGESVYSYQNSSLRLGLSPLSPKVGVATGDDSGGWSHNVYTLSPGIPGDSGSAFIGPTGGAVGVLSTIELLPRAASNNVSDLSRDLSYMRGHSTLSAVQLADGTEPFAGLI